MKLDLFTTILIIAVLILLFILYVGNQKGWFKPKPPQLNLKDDGGTVEIDTSGNVDMELYKSKARAIRDNLYVWNTNAEGMYSTAVIVYNLTNNELRLVSNAYNDIYSGKDYPTIRALINGESWGCFYGSTVCENAKAILARLDEIGA